ncbi:MAG: RCC1 domain-containing protein [Bdellovibrionales bacterium]
MKSSTFFPFVALVFLQACFLSPDSTLNNIEASTTVSISLTSGQSASVSSAPIYFDLNLNSDIDSVMPNSILQFTGPTVLSYSISKISDSVYRVTVSSISGTGRLTASVNSINDSGLSLQPQSGASSVFVDISSGSTGITSLKNISQIDGNLYNTCYLSGTDVYCAGVDAVPTKYYHITPFFPKKISQWNDVKHLCSGDYITCVHNNDGTVNCAGDSPTLLGGTAADQDIPAANALTDVSAFDCGQAHSCGIIYDGTGDEGQIFCWGSNDAGQIGQGTSGGVFDSPTQITGVTNLKDVDAGHGHTCVIKSDDTVACWGYNNKGQSGQAAGANITTMTDVPSLTNIQGIKLNRYNSCALNTSNQLYCWGQNDQSQLGDGTTTSTHVPVLFASNVIEFVVGYEYICARNNSGDVLCAGINSYGRLPITSLAVDALVSTPTALTLPQTPNKIMATREAFCITHGADDEALCWGESRFGQFGNDFETVVKTPTQVTSYTNVVEDISSGYDYTCSIVSNTTAVGALSVPVSSQSDINCHGNTWYYKLGNGVFGSHDYVYHTPVPISSSVTDPVEIDSGRYHTCYRTAANTLHCVGYGALGDGTSIGFKTSPVTVDLTGVDTPESVSLAALSSCLLGSGNVYCWGDGVFGQLGQGVDLTVKTTPQAVALGGAASKISSKHNNHCALVSGAVKCWGDNSSLQLGESGFTTSESGTPRTVSLPSTATDFSVGYKHGCAVVAGEVYCWGESEFGQLGSAQSSGNFSPTKVNGLSSISISKIFSGYRHNCALTTLDKLYCWGDNHSGQIGNGNLDEIVSTPVEIIVPGTISKVSLGRSHSCVISSDRQYCWGNHAEGQLGLGEKKYTTDSMAGTQVLYNTDFEEMP